MYGHDANQAYHIINARHQDIRNAEEARRFAKANQADQPGLVARTINGIASFARNLSNNEASQPATEAQVRLNVKRHA